MRNPSTWISNFSIRSVSFPLTILQIALGYDEIYCLRLFLGQIADIGSAHYAPCYPQ